MNLIRTLRSFLKLCNLANEMIHPFFEMIRPCFYERKREVRDEKIGKYNHSLFGRPFSNGGDWNGSL
jgi:hypothetical protein